LPPRKSVTLSSLFSQACKRLDIATERAMGCERVETTLILHLTPDQKVNFELIEDEESGQIVLGPQIDE
jgi:hypothetical protein